jgi:hypothetical protein
MKQDIEILQMAIDDYEAKEKQALEDAKTFIEEYFISDGEPNICIYDCLPSMSKGEQINEKTMEFFEIIERLKEAHKGILKAKKLWMENLKWR